MGLGAVIKQWFKKLGNLIAKLWDKAKPLVKAVLSEAAQRLWDSSQDLLQEAWEYVEEQGLPTSDAKRKAFKDYMTKKAKAEWEEIKEGDQDTILQIAHSIFSKASSS